MNKLLLTLVGVSFLATSGVWACPDLAGSYECEGGHGFYEVFQKKNNTGVTEYHIRTQDGAYTFVTDGKRRDVNIPELNNADYAATCKENVVRVDANGTYMGIRVHADSKLRKDADGNVRIDSILTYMGQRQNDNRICKVR